MTGLDSEHFLLPSASDFLPAKSTLKSTLDVLLPNLFEGQEANKC